jgi:hypothetical protein
MFDEMCQSQLVGFGCLILVNSGLARVLLAPRCASDVIVIPITFLRIDSFLITM